MGSMVALPDGRTLQIPPGASPDQLAQLKLKLGSTYPDLKTGQGMTQYAQKQAQGDIGTLADRMSSSREPHREALENRIGTEEYGRRAAAGEAKAAPYMDAYATAIGTGGLAPEAGTVPALLKTGGRILAGGYAGGKAGRYVGGDVGGWISPRGREIGQKVGNVAGSAVGGWQGLRGGEGFTGRLIDRMMGRTAAPAAAKTAEAALPEVVHAPMKPTGVQNVPEGNAQNIPRAELPKILQRTGDPAIVKEVQRLGTPVLHVPEEGYSGNRLSGTLRQRMRNVEGGATPNVPKATPNVPKPRATPPMKTGEGTGAVNLAGPEAPKTNLSQEMMSKAHDEERLRQVLKNPKATEEERRYARTVLGGEGENRRPLH